MNFPVQLYKLHSFSTRISTLRLQGLKIFFEAVKGLGGTEQAALVAVVDGIIDDTMMMP